MGSTPQLVNLYTNKQRSTLYLNNGLWFFFTLIGIRDEIPVCSSNAWFHQMGGELGVDGTTMNGFIYVKLGVGVAQGT